MEPFANDNIKSFVSISQVMNHMKGLHYPFRPVIVKVARELQFLAAIGGSFFTVVDNLMALRSDQYWPNSQTSSGGLFRLTVRIIFQSFGQVKALSISKFL